MKTDEDVRRLLDRMACEPNGGAVDPAPVIARAYRRLARTTSVLGVAGVTLVAAIVLAGPSLFQASPDARARPVAAAACARRPWSPQRAPRTSRAWATDVRTWSRRPSRCSPTACTWRSSSSTRDDGARCSSASSGWMTSVGFSSPDHTRFRTVGIDGYDHVAIGCFESLADWPPPPGSFHRRRSSRRLVRGSCRAGGPKGREVGREALRHHLEQGLVLREPGQWMPTEAPQTDARGHGALHGPLGLLGDEDLAAVSGRADPRDRVHRDAHVPGVGQGRPAAVDHRRGRGRRARPATCARRASAGSRAPRRARRTLARSWRSTRRRAHRPRNHRTLGRHGAGPFASRSAPTGSDVRAGGGVRSSPRCRS